MLGFLLAVLLALERQSRGGGRGEQHVGCGAVEAGRVTGVGRAVHEDHRDEAGHGGARSSRILPDSPGSLGALKEGQRSTGGWSTLGTKDALLPAWGVCWDPHG